MYKNQKEEVLNTKIINITSITSAIMMNIGLMTVALEMNILISIICSVITFISLIVTLLEMWKYEKKKIIQK